MFRIEKQYLSSDLKISDVVINNPYVMLLLEHFGIEVPVQEKTVDEICNEYHINSELFITFVNLYNGIPYTPKAGFSIHDLLTITKYLKNSHKYYSEEIYPNILRIIRKMNEANDLKEMGLVEKFFDEYFTEVSEHLTYENEVVFPYILELHRLISENKKLKKRSNYKVSEYKDHHNDIQEKLSDLKNLLVKYLPEKNDQPLRRELLFRLFELEYDLSVHSQIEDQILIPLVGKLEALNR